MAEQVEKAVLNFYLERTYPTWLTWRNARMGPVPPPSFLNVVPEEAAKYTGQFRYFADAVVSDGKKVVIIECKVRRPIVGIGELLTYRDQFSNTPAFSAYKELPVELELVTVFPDAQAQQTAEGQGIRFVVFEEGEKVLPSE